MKKYNVSLAVKIQQNYNIEVEAESELDAQNKAIEDFNSDFTGEISDDYIGDAVLDLKTKRINTDGTFSGTWVSEVIE
jgi:hypothetical protein